MASSIEIWIFRLLFLTISLAAFLGNCLVIWIIIKKRKIYFERPFDIFILNLAISDVLAAVFLVFSRFVYLPLTPHEQSKAYLYCSFLWGGYILFALGYVSVYTCLVLTIERWMAIVKPQAYGRLKKKQTLIGIVLIWIWGFILNGPVFLSTKAETTLENKTCRFVHLKTGWIIFPLLQVFFTCFLPCTVIISLYMHIFYKINRMPLFLRGAAGVSMKKRLTMIALVASSVLIIGWLPTQVSYFLNLVTSTNVLRYNTNLYNIFIMMTFVNCLVNPILYGVFSSRCRKEYISVLRGILVCFAWRNKIRVTPTGAR